MTCETRPGSTSRLPEAITSSAGSSTVAIGSTRIIRSFGESAGTVTVPEGAASGAFAETSVAVSLRPQPATRQINNGTAHRVIIRESRYASMPRPGGGLRDRPGGLSYSDSVTRGGGVGLSDP